MARTVVGLFSSAAEAQFATEQLLAAGFQRHNINVATQDTLRAQHLPATADGSAPVESFEEGIVRFFTDLFAGHETDDAPAHIAATSADTAVLTVNAATEEEADRARTLLNANGAADVYKQAASRGYVRPTPTNYIVDLEGSLYRVRDADDLDANGLTTH
jgi:predicted SnoaL-like aldol condensation-catalyzing enzyme